jgi:hypothetical protein
MVATGAAQLLASANAATAPSAATAPASAGGTGAPAASTPATATTTYAPAAGTAQPSTTPGVTSTPAASTPGAVASTPTVSTPTSAAAASSATPAQAHATGKQGDQPLSTGAIVIASLAALLVLACAAWGLARRSAFEPHWLLSLRHSMAEAGFRVSATWSEFADWVRLGH